MSFGLRLVPGFGVLLSGVGLLDVKSTMLLATAPKPTRLQRVPPSPTAAKPAGRESLPSILGVRIPRSATCFRRVSLECPCFLEARRECRGALPGARRVSREYSPPGEARKLSHQVISFTVWMIDISISLCKLEALTTLGV